MPKDPARLTDPVPRYLTTGSITATLPRRAVATSLVEPWLGKAEPARWRSICKPSLPNDRFDDRRTAIGAAERDLDLA